jgi:hypothetical protein
MREMGSLKDSVFLKRAETYGTLRNSRKRSSVESQVRGKRLRMKDLRNFQGTVHTRVLKFKLLYKKLFR